MKNTFAKPLIIAVVLSFICSFFCFPKTCLALSAEDFDLFPNDEVSTAEFSEILDEQLSSLELSFFDEFLQNTNSEIAFENGFENVVISLVKGEFFEGGQTFVSGIISVFFTNFTSLVPPFVTVLAVTILVSVLSSFTSDFLKQDMQNLLSFALALAVIAIVSQTAIDIVSDVSIGIDILATQAEYAFPILITLVYALGGTASASCFSPLLYFLSNVILKLVSQWIFPMFLLIFGINMISAITPQMNFSPLADFFLSVCKYALGITFTIFSACMALGGISAGSFDSISYRTAKYAIASSVPVIGSYVRDGFDLILFSAVLIKNAVGVGFVVLAFFAMLAPLSKLIGGMLLFKLCEGLTATFAPKEVSTLFKSVSKSLSLVMVSYIAVFFMYAIGIIILLVGTNIVL